MYVVKTGRTVFGKKGGALAKLSAQQLMLRLLDDAKMTAERFEKLDSIVVGCTRTAGLGPMFHRQIAAQAGWESTYSVGISSGCVTGILSILEGQRFGPGLRLACTVDSMSRAPKLLMDNANTGEYTDPLNRKENAQISYANKTEDVKNVPEDLKGIFNTIVEHNIHDGFRCPLTGLTPLEQVVRFVDQYSRSRDDLDQYAVESHKNACEAWDTGAYDELVHPMENLVRDEPVRRNATVKGFSTARAFGLESPISPSNCCTPSDGAAFALLSDQPMVVDTMGVRHHARARILDITHGFSAPECTFKSAVPAILSLLQRNGLAVEDIDDWQLSDPFSLVGLWQTQALGLDPKKVNPLGGTIAIGHPSGVTGLRLLQNAIISLERQPRARYSVVATPGIMGQGAAMLVSRT